MTCTHRYQNCHELGYYKRRLSEYVRNAALSQFASAWVVSARVQELGATKPAHVIGHGRNGGHLLEDIERLRRSAADGRCRLGSPDGAYIEQYC